MDAEQWQEWVQKINVEDKSSNEEGNQERKQAAFQISV